jgi:hypothetical protein
MSDPGYQISGSWCDNNEMGFFTKGNMWNFWDIFPNFRIYRAMREGLPGSAANKIKGFWSWNYRNEKTVIKKSS